MAEEKNGLVYQAQSPDEGALVSAARNFGFVFKSRTPKTITCVIRGEERTYDVLHMLDFNNERKRMSVICRIDGQLTLFCKGADTVIKERLRKPCVQLFERSAEDHLNRFAEDALRTLCLAWRYISEAEYAAWAAEYKEASTSMVERAAKVNVCYEKIERELEFVGSTAIEDKLQDGVPECIAKLARANIKIWVLTGDKLETAVNIGYSCQLLTNDMEVSFYLISKPGEFSMQIRARKFLFFDPFAF
jgi:phospholipid-translocating ATPase